MLQWIHKRRFRWCCNYEGALKWLIISSRRRFWFVRMSGLLRAPVDLSLHISYLSLPTVTGSSAPYQSDGDSVPRSAHLLSIPPLCDNRIHFMAHRNGFASHRTFVKSDLLIYYLLRKDKCKSSRSFIIFLSPLIPLLPRITNCVRAVNAKRLGSKPPSTPLLPHSAVLSIKER